MTQVLRIALTGGIASGKSTVAAAFERRGITVLDSDQLAREVVAPGTSGFAAVVARFGAAIVAGDGTIDRRALRAIVFADPAARRDLEAITHPRIRAAMAERAAASGGPYQIFMIPLLAEGGRAAEFDRVLVVDCPEEQQLQRVMARDQTDAASARAILAVQASRAARLAIADDVIVNDGDRSALEAQIEALHQRYLEAARVAVARSSSAE